MILPFGKLPFGNLLIGTFNLFRPFRAREDRGHKLIGRSPMLVDAALSGLKGS